MASAVQSGRVHSADFSIATVRCGLSGDSCYQPVLGSFGLVCVYVLVGMGLCVFVCMWACITGRDHDERQRRGVDLFGNRLRLDPMQYQRMDEAVEMR